MAVARGACASAWPLAAARGWVLRAHAPAALVPPLADSTSRRRRHPGHRRRGAASLATAAGGGADANANADDDWQQRSRLLFKPRGLDALARARVLVVGLGGVGSYAAEALARAGVGHLTVVDGDSVDPTNRNRQLLALRSTVGRPKAEVLAERLLDVNPRLRLTVLQRFLDPEGAAGLLLRREEEEEGDEDGIGGRGGPRSAETLAPLGNADPADPAADPAAPPPPPYYDFVLDCIDSIAPKVALIAAAARAGSRVVAAMGAGGRVDPTRVRLVDVAHTGGDALGRAVRRGLRRAGVVVSAGGGGQGEEEAGEGRAPSDDAASGTPPSSWRRPLFRPPPGAIVCVFSDEPARRASLAEVARTPANPYKASYFGTSSYVPAAFGLVAASAVVRTLADGAAMGDLLWVPPSVAAAREKERERERKRQQQRRRRRAAAAEAAVVEVAAGEEEEEGEGRGQPPPAQGSDPAARLRAWADRTLPVGGAGGVGVDGSGI